MKLTVEIKSNFAQSVVAGLVASAIYATLSKLLSVLSALI